MKGLVLLFGLLYGASPALAVEVLDLTTGKVFDVDVSQLTTSDDDVRPLPAGYYCIARNLIGRPFTGSGETQGEAEMNALEMCARHSLNCYITRCEHL